MSTDTDTQPSIAELQRLLETEDPDADCSRCRQHMHIPADLDPSALCDRCAQQVLAESVPVLLEIAAAALTANSTACDCNGESACEEACAAMRACRAFDAALGKVRP